MADLNKLQEWFTIANEQKERLQDIYNDVATYTDVTSELDDSDTSSNNPDFRNVKTVVRDSINSLSNFIINTLLSRGDEWASIQINEDVYANTQGLDSVTSQAQLQEINEELEKSTSIVFTYINQSNFYKEVSRFIVDAFNLGTGCLKQVETNNPITPFVFKYENTNNLYFTEDGEGVPNYVFKKHFNKTGAQINDMYIGYKDYKPPAMEDTEKLTITESVVPVEDSDTPLFNYVVTDEEFSTVYLDVELEYNPFIIARWKLEGDFDWGIGIGIDGLESFEQLNEWTELRQKQSRKIVNPPIKASGNKALLHKIDLSEGKVNYGGSGLNVQGLQGEIDTFNIDPIYLTQTLLPLDQDIAEVKRNIKDLYMSDPLGTVEEYKGRTATETQARLQMARARWSGSFELLQDELLEPILKNSFIIMVKKQMIVFDTENFSYTNVNFINELSKLQASESIENIVKYINIAQLIVQGAEQAGLKVAETLLYTADKYDIPLELRIDIQDINKAQEQLRQLREQFIAQQQIEGGIPSDTGTTPEIQET